MIVGEPDLKGNAAPSVLAERFFGDDYYGRPRFGKYLSYFPAEGAIVDFGCRDGVFLNFLRQHGREGLGVDNDAAVVEECHKFGLDAVCADILEFAGDPANEGKFAGILMADFVEHFDPYRLQDLLRRSIQILRPGGALVIITPNSHSLLMCTWGFYECTIEHHNTYSIRGLRMFLENEGLRVVASGVDRDSRSRVLTLHPLRLARNLAFWAVGRIICGKECLYQHAYLVLVKPGADNPSSGGPQSA